LLARNWVQQLISEDSLQLSQLLGIVQSKRLLLKLYHLVVDRLFQVCEDLPVLVALDLEQLSHNLVFSIQFRLCSQLCHLLRLELHGAIDYVLNVL